MTLSNAPTTPQSPAATKPAKARKPRRDPFAEIAYSPNFSTVIGKRVRIRETGAVGTVERHTFIDATCAQFVYVRTAEGVERVKSSGVELVSEAA